MNKLCVIGSVNVDHVFEVKDFSQPGQTIHCDNYAIYKGGKGANQAAAAARITDISFLACIGNDEFGKEQILEFNNLGIDTSHVEIIEDRNTGLASIQINSKGENSIVIDAGANEALSPQLLKKHSAVIAASDYALVQLETPMETVEVLADICQQNRTKLILNPAPAKPLSKLLLNNIYIITPNETETEVITGINVSDDFSLQDASEWFHNSGVDIVIITLGARGVYLCERGKPGKLISGYRVNPVDTTGAGDIFNGVLAASLSNNVPIEDAIDMAQAYSAIAVTRAGAQTSIPSADEVKDFILSNVG